MIKRKSKQRGIPTLGELRNPVALYEASSVPDDFDGFDTSVKPVMTLWAKVDMAAASYSKGGTANSTDSSVDAHEFITRGEGVKVHKGMYLFHESTMFQVVYAQPLKQTDEWLVIYVVDRGLIQDGDFTVTDGDGNETGQTNEDADFWKDGF